MEEPMEIKSIKSDDKNEDFEEYYQIDHPGINDVIEEVEENLENSNFSIKNESNKKM